MKFWEAMRELQAGNKVRRKDWPSTEWLSLNGDEKGRGLLEFALSHALDSGDDWEIYEEPKRHECHHHGLVCYEENNHLKLKAYTDHGRQIIIPLIVCPFCGYTRQQLK